MADSRDQPFIDKGNRILRFVASEVGNGEIVMVYKIQDGYVVSAELEHAGMRRQEKK